MRIALKVSSHNEYCDGGCEPERAPCISQGQRPRKLLIANLWIPSAASLRTVRPFPPACDR